MSSAERMRIGLVPVSVKQAFNRWAASRRPKGRVIELNQRRIFIFPNATGWAFILIACLLLLVGINYENNLIHAIAFLLLSIFVLAILHTYANLSGLKVTARSGHPCFAGEEAEFELYLEASGKRVRENLQLSWKGGPAQTVNGVLPTGEAVRLYCPAPERGELVPGPLLIESSYPLGLLRVWSWLEPETSTLVYPAPLSRSHPDNVQEVDSGDSSRNLVSGDDFFGLEPYQPGMPLRHVAWKNYARGQGMHSKSFAAHSDHQLWLEWDSLYGHNTEQRLSVLCYQVLEAERKGETYGVRLPGKRFEPDSGEVHRHRILAALARYPGGANG